MVLQKSTEWILVSLLPSLHSIDEQELGQCCRWIFLECVLQCFRRFFGNVQSNYWFIQCDPRGNCAKCSNIYRTCCCCDYIFELIRTDAYAYINLSGIPYCNAARECEALCKYNESFRSSQSCLRLYRIAAHIFLVALVAIICYFILQGKGSDYLNWFILALIIFGSYCILTYFIDIHANAA